MTNEQGYALLKQVQELAKPFGYVLFGEGWFQLQITNWSDLKDCHGDQTKQKRAYDDYRIGIKDSINALLKYNDLKINLRVLGWDGKLILDGHSIGFGYPFPAPDFPTREQLFNVKQAALYLSVNYRKIGAGTIYKQLESGTMKGHDIKVGKKTRWTIPQSSLEHYAENHLGQFGNPHLIETGRVK